MDSEKSDLAPDRSHCEKDQRRLSHAQNTLHNTYITQNTLQ